MQHHAIRTDVIRRARALALPFLAVLLTFSIPRAATSFDGFGLGFMIGSPSGVSGSLPLGGNQAVHAAVGYDLNGPLALRVVADYVWFKPEIIPVESGRISAYFGPGGVAELSGDASIGIRAVGGLDYRFAQAPVQIFLEFGPGIRILPDTEADATAGLGARYFF